MSLHDPESGCEFYNSLLHIRRCKDNTEKSECWNGKLGVDKGGQKSMINEHHFKTKFNGSVVIVSRQIEFFSPDSVSPVENLQNLILFKFRNKSWLLFSEKRAY